MARRRKAENSELAGYVPVMEKFYILNGTGTAPHLVEAPIFLKYDLLLNTKELDHVSKQYAKSQKAEGTFEGMSPDTFFYGLKFYPYCVPEIPGIDPNKEIRDCNKEEIYKIIRACLVDNTRVTLPKRESFNVSSIIAGHIAKKKTPSVFDSPEGLEDRVMEFIVNDGQIEDPIYSHKNTMKDVVLSNSQNRVLKCIETYISDYFKTAEGQLVVKEITKDLDWDGKSITFPINLEEFTKSFSPDGKARTRDQQRIWKAIKAISEIEQRLSVKHITGKGKNKKETPYIWFAPLITIEDKVYKDDTTINDETLPISFVLRVHRLFAYRFNSNNFEIPRDFLVKYWGSRGSGTETELFSILLNDIGGQAPFYQNIYADKVRELKSPDEKDIQKLKDESLVYTQTLLGFRDKIPTVDYSSTKQYRDKFRKDTDSALAALTRYGIIESGELVKNDSGEYEIRIKYKPKGE